ncbi:Broad specificity phosphatase PhoE [Moraxella cuniculi DSM 21768]|uniref:Broad specificity phosphatase PhoE n=1 Tax=Moraxella cuniculi DSM 21768 TaxID=1122245 RepID=A0A1N7FDI7_9GAMM|nr:histidine phosphatase family protein [Moraxella cuniculi]SIR98373.1 Broad specificity phosphatase PhoE [Moraxella cuniculi DSM 21768]
MKKIYLIRHGQSEANAGTTVYPNETIPLSRLGSVQAWHLAQWLHTTIQDVDAVFVSPYLRTQQTAQPYLTKTDLIPSVLPCLQELDMLAFENIASLSFAEIGALAEKFWQQDNHYRDGENTDSFDDFVKRVQAARQHFEQMADGTYVMFGHGIWISMLIWQLMHQDDAKVQDKASFASYKRHLYPNNCAVYLLSIDDDNHALIGKVYDGSTPPKTANEPSLHAD